MKKVLSLLTLAGAVAGAVWYSRQQAGLAPAQGEWQGRPAELKAVPDAGSSTPSGADDLTKIKGIGPVSAKTLGTIGITTFAALGAADPATIAAQFDSRADVNDWIAQAKQLKG